METVKGSDIVKTGAQTIKTRIMIVREGLLECVKGMLRYREMASPKQILANRLVKGLSELSFSNEPCH